MKKFLLIVAMLAGCLLAFTSCSDYCYGGYGYYGGYYGGSLYAPVPVTVTYVRPAPPPPHHHHHRW